MLGKAHIELIIRCLQFDKKIGRLTRVEEYLAMVRLALEDNLDN